MASMVGLFRRRLLTQPAVLRRTLATTTMVPSTPSVSTSSSASSIPTTTITTVTSSPPSNIYLFDKHRVVQRLEENGLTRRQAESVMLVLNEVVSESIANFSKRVVTRTEQEKNVYSYKADFAELKSELHMLEKNDFAILKNENERLLGELDKAKALMREEVNKLQFSVRLDQNLEKGRLRDEALVQEAKIKDTDKRIDTEISNIRTQLETLKFDIFKYIIGSLISALTLMIGYYRLIKS